MFDRQTLNFFPEITLNTQLTHNKRTQNANLGVLEKE